LPPGIFEKDLLITEVLRTVVAVESDGIQLVFCGGTCLSKAHGLIERMSEDIDFKLVLPQGLSRSARSRLLSQFKKRLAAALMEAGFAVPADEIIARDENSYVSLNLHYESRYHVLHIAFCHGAVLLNTGGEDIDIHRSTRFGFLTEIIQHGRAFIAHDSTTLKAFYKYIHKNKV
jgi:hypothetical protein